jgi:1,4-dihydroxy-2-naphthoate polyprenyltransferase
LTPIKAWLNAFRLRTLPLAFSSILLGSFLALKEEKFSFLILLWAMLTTLFLQVLSNLANDYGDFVKGTDNENRIGPLRTLQAGLIQPKAMKFALVLFSIFSLISGISLLFVAGAFSEMRIFWFFLGTGLFCIIAAITYTIGNNAYGYKGLGDISVLLFFGIVGVLGTHFLMTKQFQIINIFPALSCGILAVGVLNLNNLRDIENDKASGKRSIPVILGFENGKKYHYLLIVLSGVFLLQFVFCTYSKYTHFLPLLSIFLYLSHVLKVKKTLTNKELDPFLKQLALISLVTSILYGLGLIL